MCHYTQLETIPRYDTSSYFSQMQTLSGALKYSIIVLFIISVTNITVGHIYTALSTNHISIIPAMSFSPEWPFNDSYCMCPSRV